MFNFIFQRVVNYYVNKEISKLYYFFFSLFKFLTVGPIILDFKKYKFYSYTSKKDLSRWMLKNLKEWDKENIDIIINLIKNDDFTFIDCGCNYGAYSIPIAAHNPATNVYAFDASKKTINKLTENVKLNNFKNIKIFNYGIGDKNGYKLFDENLNNYNNSGSFRFIKDNKNGTQRLKIYSLDELVKNKIIKLSRNLIVKIDIEGYEFKALKGMEEMIKYHNIFIFFEFSKMLIKNEKNFQLEFDKFLLRNKLDLFDLNFKKIQSTKLFEILSKTDTRYQTIGDYILTKKPNEKN